MQNYLNARKRPLGILRSFGLSCFWELIQITCNANHHFFCQVISLSTVVQLFYISAVFINNFRNTGLQTNHFWDNINQNSVQDLQGKKQSKKWRWHCPIKIFPYITVDWPSEQQIPLTIGPRWNNKGELGIRWCVNASSPQIIIFQIISRCSHVTYLILQKLTEYL